MSSDERSGDDVVEAAVVPAGRVFVWRDVGHEAPRRAVRAALAAGRLAHAWVVTGEPGIGKAAFADWIVRLRWCTGEAPPCDRCPSCRKVATGNHPDLERVRRNPSVDPDGHGSRHEITVDQVRHGIVAALARRAVEGRGRAVIVLGAEDMNEEAQNALLKTLEEPPRGCLLLLVSAREEALLPTVRSRCQELRLLPLAPREVEALVGPVDPALAALVRGRPGLAPAYAALDVRALADALDGLLAGRLPAGGFAARVRELAEQAAAPAELAGLDEPERRRLVLSVLATRLRDLALQAAGDGEEAPRPAAQAHTGLLAATRALWEAGQDVDRHLPAAACWTVLGDEILAAVGGRRESERQI